MDMLTGSGRIMHNESLIKDYLKRAGHRIEATELLFKRESYADVVRESQEIVELCLKALLRFSRIEPPRLHDLSQILNENKDRLPQNIRPKAALLGKISKSLRRDRELAFYGSEDLTPGEFYNKDDAIEALENAKTVYQICSKIQLN